MYLPLFVNYDCPVASIFQAHAPASSLRSRLQEQRAKARELAESTGREESVPVFTSPVKPDPVVTVSAGNKHSSPLLRHDTGDGQSDIDSRFVYLYLSEVCLCTKPSEFCTKTNV